jgi:hypothetical protein
MSIMGESLGNWLDKRQPESISVMHSNMINWMNGCGCGTSILEQDEPGGLINPEEYKRKLYEIQHPVKPRPAGESPVCALIPDGIKDQMADMINDSEDNIQEVGSAIREGYELGPIAKGTEHSVKITRPPDTIGTYHTHLHTGGMVQPGEQDIIESLLKKDKVICLGGSLKFGPKINCFTPIEPKWSQYRLELVNLMSDLRKYYQDIADKFGLVRIKQTEEGPVAIPIKKVKAVTLKRLLKYVADPEYVNYTGNLEPTDITNLKADADEKLAKANSLAAAVDVSEGNLEQAPHDIEIAQNNYNKALKTGDEGKILKAGLALRDAEQMPGRIQSQLATIRRLANDADAEYEIARIRAETKPGDLEKGRENANWAEQRLRQGVDLELRRRKLLEGINNSLKASDEHRPDAIAQCNLVGNE